ncbi:glycogen debranching protein GlgX [Candidatus Methylocalor cossyra]
MKSVERALDLVPVKKPVFSYCAGSPLPHGVHLHKGGVNFALFSRHATRVWLLLFEDIHATEPFQTIELDPRHHKTGDMWHICIEGAGRGLVYAYRVDGPNAPEHGHRFDSRRILLDPYATALASPPCWDFSGFCSTGAPTADDPPPHPPAIVKNVVTANGFDWEDDRPLYHPWSDLVIYETHVRGLTMHPSSGGKFRGSYLGVIDKIPYLKRLGITAVEFMPLQEFNPHENTLVNPETGERLKNYWGYNTIAFFAPYEGYGSRLYPGCQVDEFKAMVKALHKAGIEVLLDVVFNHTAEGDETGPTLNFRGLDNSIYYILEEDKRRYKNYSGCGNTMNCNHPVVRNYILDCLRYWVVEMHVDGFRFDLASILGRDRNGQLVPNPPLLEQIAEDPILRDVKLIAEAWDAGGAYLVGRFPGERWSEWNGHYRDDVRRYWRGDPGMAGALASRLCGSADVYEHSGKAPVNSINFVTCHDGFTLNDLVSYERKHNFANGENNRDGCNCNYSANYGWEGPTDDPTINRIRLRQMKNFMATLLVSRGVPMILGGDEFCRTQRGNNNAYCQDNEISWYDWTLVEKNRDFLEFVRGMIAFRRRHPVLSREKFYRPEDVSWFNPAGLIPDWHGDTAIGSHIHVRDEEGPELCLLFNAHPHPVSFVLPAPPQGCRWFKMVDTDAAPPFDVCQPGHGVPQQEPSLWVQDRSMVVLVAEPSA